MNIKTADLCDQYPKNVSVCQIPFNSYGGRLSFSGPIETVEVYEDNTLVRQALETIPKGSVLVVNGGGSKNCALVGDVLAGIAVSRELVGIIINGCVRDSSELAKMNIGILALGTIPLKSKKLGKGKSGANTKFGGINWTPGEYVYADEDGVIVSSIELIPQT